MAFSVAALAGLVLALWPLIRAHTALKGTTLLNAYWWAVSATVGWIFATFAEVLLGDTTTPISYLGYIAAVLAVCPFMAVLGARRPGATAWHFVVAALLVVLLLPVLQAPLRLRTSDPLRLEEAPSLLYMAVLAVGVVNYLPTRFGLAAAVLGLGTLLPVMHLSPWTKLADVPLVASGAKLAPLMLASSVWIAWARAQRSTRCPDGAWNHAWRDFHDWFGLVWAARVMERFNAASRQFGWPLLLSWHGFHVRDSASRKDKPAASAGESVDELLTAPGPMQTAVTALLQRFVQPQWIAERVEGLR